MAKVRSYIIHLTQGEMVIKYYLPEEDKASS
jgi:hypothetical protein